MASPLRSHLGFLTATGVGLFSDGYLNITIGLIVPMLGCIYFQDEKDKVPTVSSDVIKRSLPLGMIVGQLLFGVFGDALGRHIVYGKELIITIFGTLMVVLLPWHGLSHNGVVAWVSVFRVVAGLGTGGDYPMTSTLCTEHIRFGSRAKRVRTIFSCIGLGATSAGIVFVVLLAAFKDSIIGNVARLEWARRLLLGLGMIPAAFTLQARLTSKETEPYQEYVATETGLTAGSGRGLKDQFRDFRVYFSEWKHAKVLFGTYACWFLFDIATYGVNLNQSIILSRIGFGTGTTPLKLYGVKSPRSFFIDTATRNIIVLFARYLPGFYLGIFLPDWVGRTRQQFIGSVIVAILYGIWAGVLNTASTAGLIILFTLSQLFMSASCNCTTFLIPTEIFPTRVRGTAHGLSAASGKAGAVLIAFTFGSITDSVGLQGVLGLFSGIMALVAILTLLIPETKGTILEDIENEELFGRIVIIDESFEDRNEAHGSDFKEFGSGETGL